MKEIIVPSKYDGKKLNTFLLDTFDSLSLNVLYKTLRKKDIRINDIRVNENVVVHTADKIKVYLSDEQLQKTANFKIDIIYEDAYICIVNKPAKIEVVGKNSFSTVLQQYYQNLNATSSSNSLSSTNNFFLAPCHRLDRNTTGLVLFAKKEEALTILLDKFKNHEIEKHYIAKVFGIPTKKQATLTAYLFKDAKKSLVYISDIPKKYYETIITSYRVLEENKKENTSLLDVTLHTGKTHQIRAHLAHIGYPILGDRKIRKQ